MFGGHTPLTRSVTAVVRAIVGGLAEAFPDCGAVLKLPAAICGARAKVLPAAAEAITDTGVLRFCAYLKICFAGTRDLLRVRSEGRERNVLALDPQGEVRLGFAELLIQIIQAPLRVPIFGIWSVDIGGALPRGTNLAPMHGLLRANRPPVHSKRKTNGTDTSSKEKRTHSSHTGHDAGIDHIALLVADLAHVGWQRRGSASGLRASILVSCAALRAWAPAASHKDISVLCREMIGGGEVQVRRTCALVRSASAPRTGRSDRRLPAPTHRPRAVRPGSTRTAFQCALSARGRRCCT